MQILILQFQILQHTYFLLKLLNYIYKIQFKLQKSPSFWDSSTHSRKGFASGPRWETSVRQTFVRPPPCPNFIYATVLRLAFEAQSSVRFDRTTSLKGNLYTILSRSPLCGGGPDQHQAEENALEQVLERRGDPGHEALLQLIMEEDGLERAVVSILLRPLTSAMSIQKTR